MTEVNRGTPRVQEKSWLERQREKTRLAAFAGALAIGTVSDEPIPVRHPAKIEVIVADELVNPLFDRPEFFEKHEGGEYSSAERAAHTRTLPNGEVIFDDVGLSFYRVERGDTIGGIRAKLSKYPEYDYLNDQRQQIMSFNIGADDLNGPWLDRRGRKQYMWLPIPLKNEDRHISDQEFEHYAKLAIKDLHELNGPYHETVEDILNKISPEEFTATLTAIAKQESGGLPIGQFELHRWEEGHHVFSFSIFHVLMEGPGLKARKNLSLTEGQTYHPQNATELFVGYLAEKGAEMSKNPASYFPLDHGNNAIRFARFYNGEAWKTTNPDYVKNILAYYKEALSDLTKKH
jgi:hypothetical protein